MPQKHDRLLVFGAGEFDLEMIAVVSDVVNFYPPAPVLKFLRQKFAHLVDSSFVVAWRFNFDHALEKGEHFRHAQFREGKISGCVLSGGGVGHQGMITRGGNLEVLLYWFSK